MKCATFVLNFSTPYTYVCTILHRTYTLFQAYRLEPVEIKLPNIPIYPVSRWQDLRWSHFDNFNLSVDESSGRAFYVNLIWPFIDLSILEIGICEVYMVRESSLRSPVTLSEKAAIPIFAWLYL